MTQAHRDGAHDVVMATYLLAPGHIYRPWADVVASPIGVHPLLAGIIVGCYHEAAGA